MAEIEPEKFYQKMPFHLFVFEIILIVVFFAPYLQGYLSSSSKVEVKSPNQAVVYQNNNQKTMDHLKELLLSDSETQNAEKRMNFSRKKSRKLPRSLLLLLLLILLSLRGG